MVAIPVAERREIRHATLEGLARLRAAFPLEARIQSAGDEIRRDYARVLTHWLRGETPPIDLISQGARAHLLDIDAIVSHEQGLGCYPFSARATGIVAELPGGRVHAMCAIDALAMARLAEVAIAIEASCPVCATGLRIRVEANGGLDHDQADRARVIWKATCHGDGPCSDNLCRDLFFLCPACAPPADNTVYTLPQAAIMANNFFGFQRRLIAGLST